MPFSIVKLFTLLTFGVAALSKPVSRRDRQLSSRGGSQSFNNFDGRSSLQNFDNFFGNDNFDGSNNQLTIIKEKEVVCKQIDVEVIQQRLTVLRESIKRILVEQVCETEVRTIVLQQFSSNIDNFSRDIRRQSNRQVSYDSRVAGLLGQLQDGQGNSRSDNLGFNGKDVGSQGVLANGDNWNSQSSPDSVGKIWQASLDSRNDAQNRNSTSQVKTVDSASSSTSAAASSTSAAAPAVSNVNSD